MPVMECNEEGKPGYKYGESGKCYTYKAGDEEGRKRAKQKAYIQGAAISARTGETMKKEDAAIFQDMLEEQLNLEKGWDKFVDDGEGLIVEYPEEQPAVKSTDLEKAFGYTAEGIEKFNPNHGNDGRFTSGHGAPSAGEGGSFNRCQDAINTQGQKVRGVQWESRDGQFKGGCHQYVVGDRASEDKAIAAAKKDQEKYTGIKEKGMDVSDVHVSTPNISGKKKKKELTECEKAKMRSEGCPKVRKASEILKMDEDRRLIYGLVLVPDVEDLQGDIVSKEEIETACHDYLVNSRLIKAQHRAPTDAEVVECYIAPVDIPLGKGIAPEGSWIMVTKVHSNAMWAAVKKGDITGYSIGGIGTREPIEE